MGSSEPLLVLVFVMKATITYAWFVLLSIIACLQKVNGDTSLMNAVRKNDVDLVKSLLANGNDVKATNKYGETALMTAAEYGSAKIMELLLPISDVKATDKYGDTALMYAARYGNEKCVELLIPNSNAKTTNNRGNTALDIAKNYGYNQIVSLLQQQN